MPPRLELPPAGARRLARDGWRGIANGGIFAGEAIRSDRMVCNVIQALMILALMAGPAAAQIIPMGQGSARPEQIEKEQREERAANRALQKVPDKERKSKDPWGNVRSAPQASGAGKKPRQ